MDKSDAIKKACSFISKGRFDLASNVIDEEYPFVPLIKGKRSYTPREMTKAFISDVFIDRYRGTKLNYPSTSIVFHLLPKQFIYHKNGKMSEARIGYWELFPIIYKVVLIARGEKDEELNWVFCSMLTNSFKLSGQLKNLSGN